MRVAARGPADVGVGGMFLGRAGCTCRYLCKTHWTLRSVCPALCGRSGESHPNRRAKQELSPIKPAPPVTSTVSLHPLLNAISA